MTATPSVVVVDGDSTGAGVASALALPGVDVTLVEEGYDAVCTCTSCSLAIRQEYPELFDYDAVDRLAGSTHEAIEHLGSHEDLAGALEEATVDYPDLAYHAPCHARNQRLQRQAVELLDVLRGVEVTEVGESCSGISGTYGWKAEKCEPPMAVGAEGSTTWRPRQGDRPDGVSDLCDADGTRNGLRETTPPRGAGGSTDRRLTGGRCCEQALGGGSAPTGPSHTRVPAGGSVHTMAGACLVLR